MTCIKLLIVGEDGVGKTSFIRRHATGKFYKYSDTEDAEHSDMDTEQSANRYKLKFTVQDIGDTEHTEGKKENIVLDIIDSCSEEKFISNLDACIIMFDVTNRQSHNAVSRIYKNLIKLYERIPIVLCGNKVDCKEREVMPADITFHQGRPIQYYDTSAKSNYNLEKPFLYIIRSVLHKQVVFAEEKSN